MALTILNIATALDSHVLYAAAGRSAAQTAGIVDAINAGLEDMRNFSPQSFRATIPLTWTPGVSLTAAVAGTSIGPSATFADYAAGCSLNIAGDDTFNELATVGDASTASSALFPYSGTSGSKAITIYGDCVKLGATVDRVIGCALGHERRPLDILGSRAEWHAYQRLSGYGADYGGPLIQPAVVRQPGIPRGIWLETVLNGSAIEYRARCAPLPNVDFRATLDVQTMPESVTSDDISGVNGVVVTGAVTPAAMNGTYTPFGSDENGNQVYLFNGPPVCFVGRSGGTWGLQAISGVAGWGGPATTSPAGSYSPSYGTADGTLTVAIASAATRPVPGHRDYNILRALCLYHWSGSPWFRNDAARAVINQGYTNAVEQLKGFRPNAAESPASTVCY
jgi:hypothetical protein